MCIDYTLKITREVVYLVQLYMYQVPVFRPPANSTLKLTPRKVLLIKKIILIPLTASKVASKPQNNLLSICQSPWEVVAAKRNPPPPINTPVILLLLRLPRTPPMNPMQGPFPRPPPIHQPQLQRHFRHAKSRKETAFFNASQIK